MKLSWSWLNDFADLNSVGLKKVLEIINTSVCEVDHVESYMPHLKTIVAVRLESVNKHPNADKLSVCEAYDGKSKIQIVTGAQNVKAGDIVPLALPGTVIAGKEIQPSALKNVQSFGMFCSEKELGFAEESQGVLILESSTKLGMSMSSLFELEDTILTIDNKSITHRPDLWSHFGFARELASQLEISIKENPFDAVFSFTNETASTVIENKNASSYYSCIVRGVKISQSKNKIKTRLEKCGTRSINNVVDVSNYVMLEMGQPTHFFDNAKLKNAKVEVSYSKKDESIQLLDGTERELEEGILIIRNEKVPVAIAGVMGGQETSVTENSKELLLESAVFRREDIRHSSRKVNIRSEAAIRYEKGLDASTTLPVLKRSLRLLQENGCDSLKASQPSGYNNESDKITIIETTFGFIEKKLGKKLKESEVLGILSRLGFQCEKTGNDSFKVTVPFYRQNYDITIPEDLVEEIGRTIGYSSIPKFPVTAEVQPVHRNYSRETEKRIKHILSEGAHFNEVFNYSFASETDTKFEGNSFEKIEIQNLMPEEFKFLRTSIYPSVLKNLAINQDRFDSARIYEFGRTYHYTLQTNQTTEKKFFGLGSILNIKNSENSISALEKEFLSFRKIFEVVFTRLNIQKFQIEACQNSYLHPNSSVQFVCDGKVIGEAGILHPRWKDIYDLKKIVLAGKIHFDDLLLISNEKKTDFRFKTPSIFPSDQLDISLVMKRDAGTENFANLVYDKQIPEIEKIWVHDIFTGGNLDKDVKSVTYRVALVTHDKTFTQDRINTIQETLMNLAESGGYKVK
ncbi:MAG: phenylalanine--tRNA ligase subunit beta [Leptospiraceae bacterium]|nr:phenylalanine--tRNA ligase subunit beta [Leptospiraceae bacterium]